MEIPFILPIEQFAKNSSLFHPGEHASFASTSTLTSTFFVRSSSESEVGSLSLPPQKNPTLIILAQALNGLLLPFTAAFLLLAANDRELLKAQANGGWSNALGLLVFTLSSFLGLKNVGGAVTKALEIEMGVEVYPVLGLMAVGLALLLMRKLGQ